MAQTPDSHDLDKLARWHEGLTSAAGGGFPLCAMFLSAGEDRRAHDIFRIYRAAFEELGAGFHDLVIFGQHGASSTSAALVPGLGLTGLQVPSLVLITRAEPAACYVIALPAGVLGEGQTEEVGGGVPWDVALETIKASVKDGIDVSLDGVAGLEQSSFAGGSLAETVGLVKQQVERA